MALRAPGAGRVGGSLFPVNPLDALGAPVCSKVQSACPACTSVLLAVQEVGSPGQPEDTGHSPWRALVFSKGVCPFGTPLVSAQ